jgi:hypothetical protein
MAQERFCGDRRPNERSAAGRDRPRRQNLLTLDAIKGGRVGGCYQPSGVGHRTGNGLPTRAGQVGG